MKGYLVINIKYPMKIEMKYNSYQADSKKTVSFLSFMKYYRISDLLIIEVELCDEVFKSHTPYFQLPDKRDSILVSYMTLL